MSDSRFPYVTCNKCGTVHFEVSREYAEAEVNRFNEYYKSLQEQERVHYWSGPSRINEYEVCWCGASYKDTRDYKEGDCPDGVTIGPIIKRNE